jgi:hypothetical protein
MPSRLIGLWLLLLDGESYHEESITELNRFECQGDPGPEKNGAKEQQSAGGCTHESKSKIHRLVDSCQWVL